MPGLYHIPTMEMNAFSVGSNRNAAIGITEGLLQQLNLRELAGIIGHEIAHIKNNDLKVIGLADIAGRITHLLSTFGQIVVLIVPSPRMQPVYLTTSYRQPAFVDRNRIRPIFI